MPTVPSNTKCAFLGCTNTRSKLNSYCDIHGGLNTLSTPKRRENNSMYHTPYWRRQRAIQLSIQPLCQACLASGKVVQAEHVDHVFPWTQVSSEAFYRNLFQSLCHEHHSYKTALEQRGICRYWGKYVADYTIDQYQTIVSTT